jgi:hypothetical protein
MQVTIFWDITQCSAIEIHRLFGGTFYLHLQGSYRLLLAGVLLGLLFDREDGGNTSLPHVSEIMPDYQRYSLEDTAVHKPYSLLLRI